MIGTDRTGGDGAGEPALRVAAGPRLARHKLTVGGRRVGVAVGGHGIPLVLASGLLLTDRMYVQTLSRLASAGFRVVAVDVAGSGISDGACWGGCWTSSGSSGPSWPATRWGAGW